MDLDAVLVTPDQQHTTGIAKHRPKRHAHVPERYAPPKPCSKRAINRDAAGRFIAHQKTSAQGSTNSAFGPLADAPYPGLAPAAAAAAGVTGDSATAAAAQAELAAASAELQLTGQYSQMLLQLQTLGGGGVDHAKANTYLSTLSQRCALVSPVLLAARNNVN